MKNTITEIENSVEAANSRIQDAEEQISEVEDRLVEITDAEQKREKRLKMKRVSENSGTMLNAPTSILSGCQKEKRERKRQKKIFQEIIAKNFPNMGKESLTQIQEAQ